MATTPEGKIKKLVKALLKEERIKCYVAHGKGLYEFWPVPSGFGASSLDCIVCYYGKFIAIETKAPGKKPTPRQHLTIEQINAADGITVVIDSQAGVDSLQYTLEMIRNFAGK